MSSPGRPLPIPLRPDPAAVNEGAMRALSRAVIAIGVNAYNPSTLPSDHARRTWPLDRDLPLVLRAAVGPASTTTAPEVQYVGIAFRDALVPQSAGADLLQRALSLEFNNAASITIPNIVVPAADFVGEEQPIPTAEAPTGDTRLERHALKVITSVTSELLHSSNAEQLIRQVLVESVGPALDRVLFSAAAAAADRPAGLLDGIAPLPAGATLVDSLVAVLEAIAPVSGNGQVRTRSRGGDVCSWH